MDLIQLVNRLLSMIDAGVPADTPIAVMRDGQIELLSPSPDHADIPVVHAEGWAYDPQGEPIFISRGRHEKTRFVLIADLNRVHASKPNETITDLETGKQIELNYEYPDPEYD